MKKSRSDYLLRRIYKLLRDENVTLGLQKLKKPYVGIAFPWSKEMAIDPRCEVLSVVVHECLHLLYEDARERKILAMEKGIMNNMTVRQFINLYMRIGCRLKGE